MARYIGPACRLCRREGIKLYIKGQRCLGDKCAFGRRSYPPGIHGQKRLKVSDYSQQLREKQKVRRIYSVLEKQFRNYYFKAERMKGITSENLLSLLERRLDNVVFRLGVVTSRNQARQMVLHRHINVNNKRVNIPSFLVKPGDVVSVHPSSVKLEIIKTSLEVNHQDKVPSWIDFDLKALKGSIDKLPTKDDIHIPVNEQLIIEHYAK